MISNRFEIHQATAQEWLRHSLHLTPVILHTEHTILTNDHLGNSDCCWSFAIRKIRVRSNVTNEAANVQGLLFFLKKCQEGPPLNVEMCGILRRPPVIPSLFFSEHWNNGSKIFLRNALSSPWHKKWYGTNYSPTTNCAPHTQILVSVWDFILCLGYLVFTNPRGQTATSNDSCCSQMVLTKLSFGPLTIRLSEI